MIRFLRIKGCVYVIIAILAGIYVLTSARRGLPTTKSSQAFPVPKTNSGEVGEEEEDFIETFEENNKIRRNRLKAECSRFLNGDYPNGVFLGPDFYQNLGNLDLWGFPDSNLVWCDIPKSGSSTIRTLAVEGILGARHRIDRNESLKYKDSMMIFRHPIERLYSGYRNKIISGVEPLLPQLGMPIKESSKLSFPQFLDQVANNPEKNLQWLFQSYTRLCNPCFYNYTYLLDVDNLSTDAAALVFQITGKRVSVGHENKHKGDKPKTVEDILDGVSADTVQKLVNQFYLDYKLFGFDLDETMEIIKKKQIQEAAEQIPEA